MIKKLVLVFIAIIAMQSYGQEGTASPYSFYGIGSLKFKGTVENRSMGGLSIYTDSIHVNLRNPASYAGKNLDILNNESRPVKFTVGGTYNSTTLKSDTSKDNASSSTFDYLAMSIPMGDFGFGFGVMPYTAVGYKLEAYNDDGETISNRFRGEGGLNKAFLGFGYQISEGFSVGVDFQYNFGNTQNSTIEYVYDSEGNPVQYQARENNRSDLSGLNINLGASYRTMLTEKLELISGITYTPESNLSSKNQRSFSTITTIASGSEFALNTIESDLGDLTETELVLPSKLTFGVGIGQPRKWFVGIESEYLKTSDFTNALYSNGATYEDQSAIKLGGFFIPKYNSFSSYLQRVVYRAGVHFENTGLNIENESINEFGMSFGLGLPVGSFFSNANLGVEVGKRGTTNSNLIQENFINFQLSLSLNDRWFSKRKFD
ncbi:putative outer membrane protein [Algibacter lectus]|uniref:Putative outer membrane protein n=1 Tax=Algibacter lectus TaxID=221126 RepID=A0A090WX48_9FLAO|nr:membrane protein [Algibacter lectus]GAL81526.1 putative outer membrane protein [Algibacter lectus]